MTNRACFWRFESFSIFSRRRSRVRSFTRPSSRAGTRVAEDLVQGHVQCAGQLHHLLERQSSIPDLDLGYGGLVGLKDLGEVRLREPLLLPQRADPSPDLLLRKDFSLRAA